MSLVLLLLDEMVVAADRASCAALAGAEVVTRSLVIVCFSSLASAALVSVLDSLSFVFCGFGGSAGDRKYRLTGRYISIILKNRRTIETLMSETCCR